MLFEQYFGSNVHYQLAGRYEPIFKHLTIFMCYIFKSNSCQLIVIILNSRQYFVFYPLGEAGEYIDLEILSDLKDTGDLAIKFKTDLKSGDSIFTDLNGHTIQQHKFKEKLKTQVCSN